MKYLLLTLIIRKVLGDSSLDLPPKIIYDVHNAKDLFDKYVVQFNKQYDDKEYEIRLAIFKDNLEDLNKFNQESNLTVYGINQFTDLKYQEVATSYLGMTEIIALRDIKEYEPFGTAPYRVDYRENGFVTEVKNQGQCNSCYIFSAIGSIEGQLAKKHGVLMSLSEQQVLDCDPGAHCSMGGLPSVTMNELAQQEGVMSSKDYPYVMKKGACRTDKKKKIVKVTGGLELTVRNEEDLKNALAYYGPLSIGITSCDRFQGYQGGLFHHNCQGMDRHAVLLVGYDAAGGKPYWIIKNSWSAVWGEQGYMRMLMGKSLCGIGSYVVSATVA